MHLAKAGQGLLGVASQAQVHEPVGLLMNEAVLAVQLPQLGQVAVVAPLALGYPVAQAARVGVAQGAFVLASAVAVQKRAQPGLKREVLDNGGLKILLDGFGGHSPKGRPGGLARCTGAK